MPKAAQILNMYSHQFGLLVQSSTYSDTYFCEQHYTKSLFALPQTFLLCSLIDIATVYCRMEKAYTKQPLTLTSKDSLTFLYTETVTGA